jgi:enoyl-CoA hydratase
MIVRFARPDMRNPLSADVLTELESIVEGFSGESDVNKVIFTGTADVFASGADIREIAKLTKQSAFDFSVRGQHLMNKIEALRQTTIAAVNGFCYGGALDLALACDRRIATPNATFCHPGVGLGIMTGWGGTQRLPR